MMIINHEHTVFILDNRVFINGMNRNGGYCPRPRDCCRKVYVHQATRKIKRIIAKLLIKSAAVRLVYIAQRFLGIYD